jgi:hypothetical protein
MAMATAGVETWEIMIEGTIWVWVYDKRSDAMQKVRVGGKAGGSRKLQITTDDRRWNQDQVIEEMKHSDPFSNGALKLIAGAPPEEEEVIDTRNHLDNEQLVELLTLRDEDVFRSEVEDIRSELLMRRLLEVADRDGTRAQVEIVRDVIEERYKVGGTQKTVREMVEAGERIGGEQMS